MNATPLVTNVGPFLVKKLKIAKFFSPATHMQP